MADVQAEGQESSVVLPSSGLDRFGGLLDDLVKALDELLDLSGIHYYDANAGSSGVYYVGWNSSRWDDLPPEAAPKVGSARKALEALEDFSLNAAHNAPDRAKELLKLEGLFKVLIEQPGGQKGAPKPTIQKVREYIAAAADQYRKVVGNLPAAHGRAEQLLVVDTSALLDRPDLQEWKIDGTAWTVILLPQVLSELDDHKRDPRTRDVAQKVINQVEDLDRRGDSFRGVPLAGKVTVREVPMSPDMGKTLSWLRPDVPDDSIIAGALELAWEDLTSRIAIAASDRNLRNKARLAGFGSIRAGDL